MEALLVCDNNVINVAVQQFNKRREYIVFPWADNYTNYPQKIIKLPAHELSIVIIPYTEWATVTKGLKVLDSYDDLPEYLMFVLHQYTEGYSGPKKSEEKYD